MDYFFIYFFLLKKIDTERLCSFIVGAQLLVSEQSEKFNNPSQLCCGFLNLEYFAYSLFHQYFKTLK
jgi:hypothetical protein